MRAHYYVAEDTQFPFDVLSLALHVSNKIFIDARFFFEHATVRIYLFIFFSVEKTAENIFFDGYEESIKANRHCVFFFFLRNSQFQLRPLTPHLSPCRFVPITYGFNDVFH